MTVAGTRAEAVKLAPLLRLLSRHPHIAHRLIATGEHGASFHGTLGHFGIDADADLGLSWDTPEALGETIGCALPHVLRDAVPHLVLVQGAGAGAWATALTSAALDLPVGHVEAGLRFSDPNCDWPEERQSREIDGVSKLLFAPSQCAAANLAGLAGKIHVTGSTTIDALLEMRAVQPLSLHETPRRMILVLVRRREIVPHLPALCAALRTIAARDDVDLLVSLAREPAIADPMTAALADVPRIHLEPRIPYPERVRLMMRAHLALTDSSGVQEEAPALGLPVLVLRDTTERPEPVVSGNTRLVGVDRGRIVAETTRLLDRANAHAAMAIPAFPYGRGDAAPRIVQAIEHWADLPASILFEPRRAYG